MTAPADEAMLAGDHDTAIRLYSRACSRTRVLRRRPERASDWVLRANAKDSSRERGSNTRPISREFPDGPDAERVRQRLAGLAADAAPARVPLEQARSAAPLWEIDGGVAQYVRQFELEPLGSRRAQLRALGIFRRT